MIKNFWSRSWKNKLTKMIRIAFAGYLLLMMLPVSISCQQLIEIWQTDAVFQSPESVLFDGKRKQIYVSNINGSSDARDGNGFLSLMDVNGSIKELKWIEGLHAPKGLALYQNRLYVTDIDHLVVIDVESASIIQRYKAEGAVFLNDAVAGGNGDIYVTDSRGDQIYRLRNNRLELWLKVDSFLKINGLYASNRFVYVGSTVIHKINRKSRRIQVIKENCGGIDGLEKYTKGRFIYSNWMGKIFLTTKGKDVCLLDVSEQKINTADINYVMQQRLLLVPTFLDNRIVAYKLQ